MTLLLGVVAQVLHIALVGVTAPTLVGVQRWMLARLTGCVGASPLQPWRDLARLFRKQTVLAESASDVTHIAPSVCASATVIAVCLVPSFALGMTFAPFADLLVIVGLLAVARGSLALVGLDAGTAVGGQAASRTLLLICLATPALLLVAFVLALRAGSLNLDLIAAAQIESGTDWRLGIGIALGALVLVALVDTMRREALAEELSGPDLALVEAADALRLLVWFNLIGAMFLPFGMAPSDAGLLAWAIGVPAWLGRTLVLATAQVVVHSAMGTIRLSRAAQTLGVAVLLGLLAAVFLFADMGTA
jgi:formate hydrogenlyase subunit 4